MRAQEMRELRREVGRERAAHWFHCGAVLGWGELVWVGVVWCVWRDGDSRVFRGFVYVIAGAVKRSFGFEGWKSFL